MAEHFVELVTGKQKHMENKEQYKEETISFQEFADRLGITDLDTPEIYDIRDEGYEILSFDHEKNCEVWSPLESYVVKKNATEHYQVNTLHGTKDHKIFVDGEYVRLEDYLGAELVKEPIQVVDCQVGNTHNYIAEGQINHNTTTPGGAAIPYACSTRLKITSTGQKHIEDKNGNVIGIQVKVKTIKNKVARPFRECEFQIHFGKGIVEHEEVFDLFRNYCASLKTPGVPVGDEFVSVEGTGAWKVFSIISSDGEVTMEKKFHKPDFKEILENPELKKYVDALYDAALIMGAEATEHSTFTGAGDVAETA